MSELDVRLDPRARRLHGTTENVEALGFDLNAAGLRGGESGAGDSLRVELDGEAIHVAWPADDRLWLERDGAWRAADAPDPASKGPHRSGPFREVTFRRTQFVVGTGGTTEENAAALAKARFDAEFLWYQGNASVDVLPDSRFDPAAEPDRSVILYGNADTNGDWGALWNDVVSVSRGRARVGGRQLRGDDIAVLAVQPRPGSDTALVGIVAASGAEGMRLLYRRPYLLPHVSYPDLTVFRDSGDDTVVRAAGFFGNDWSLEDGDVVWGED